MTQMIWEAFAVLKSPCTFVSHKAVDTIVSSLSICVFSCTPKKLSYIGGHLNSFTINFVVNTKPMSFLLSIYMHVYKIET